MATTAESTQFAFLRYYMSIMTIFSYKKEPLLLLIGDIFSLFASLWLMLAVRYGEMPSREIYMTHLLPFAILFIVWILVFFIAGLYEKHTIMLRKQLWAIIIRAQIANSILAVAFFYFIPFFNITPKTNLFIYLVIFFLLTVTWRIYGRTFFAIRHRQKALLVGSGKEMHELFNEVNSNDRYDLVFTSIIDLDTASNNYEALIHSLVSKKEVDLITIDLNNEKVEPMLPTLYSYMFSNVQFIDMHKLYEEIFDRVPLTIIKYNWFLENISTAPKVLYDLIKRLMDLAISLPSAIISLILYPFVALFIKLDDGGPLFITQKRIGQNDKPINILKFRTMKTNDQGNYSSKTENRVTRVGKYLRRSRIDELPQLWNVVRGDISLIGPRPELPLLVTQYEEQIPYYKIRHLIKPGLSGWAQIYHEKHPHHGVDTEETKNKLSYDLYYIKNRSLLLDIKITLRTIKTLLSRSGI